MIALAKFNQHHEHDEYKLKRLIQGLIPQSTLEEIEIKDEEPDTYIHNRLRDDCNTGPG